ncbi:2-hydroxy-3-keto-5-methylthiopentenyl-1-phosphate phosphatase [Exiguobacterium sp. CH10]|uniref:2-hydroxy-3-keto-5-methylthiopentenyl-1- phosphate phosphatase n=1 Tax=Exiguobacterium sp. CH10 TaxID=2751261 RepID=UPI001BE97C05|nr:2-hydroxy-3-keto-5-methylthiopentenyl-1-phosphate phosphatase [Exiguobacterium sp. CH10]
MSTHVICDFDGTITEEDNIIVLMRRFAPPEWVELKDGVLNQTLSIREGVGQMFSLLPSHQETLYRDFLQSTITLRAGFVEFLQEIQSQGFRFDVVSGGMDFFVHPILEGHVAPEHIYCNHVDFSEATARVTWPHSCDVHCSNDCGCCKPTIARQIVSPTDTLIVIGDSVTDFEIAKRADVVYARGQLISLCEAEGIHYVPFETFHDISAYTKGVNV